LKIVLSHLKFSCLFPDFKESNGKKLLGLARKAGHSKMEAQKYRTFFGFGFGPIQAGLFIHEAIKSGNFNRFVIAEVNPKLVSQIRGNQGRVNINIAYSDRVEKVALCGIEIYNPEDDQDQRKIIDAISMAEEMATAVPSVNAYRMPSQGSIHRLLAAGIGNKPPIGEPFVIYTAENNIRAAQILQKHVDDQLRIEHQTKFNDYQGQILNTVIGKMSQIVDLKKLSPAFDLIPIVPSSEKAILVEEFNNILISEISIEPCFRRGIKVFREKPDLSPFEETKLFGHNATHASLGFFGNLFGETIVSDLKGYPGLIRFIRAMFIEEAGTALCRKYQGVDEMFSKDNFKRYAEDLLERMLNPFLMDSVDRLTRDVERKLGWDDRMIGAIRLCLKFNVKPDKLAFSAVAALCGIDGCHAEQRMSKLDLLSKQWLETSRSAQEVQTVSQVIKAANEKFSAWEVQGFPHDKLIGIVA
jgi:mannitol-1-phosphate 5-dehydrogenase